MNKILSKLTPRASFWLLVLLLSFSYGGVSAYEPKIFAHRGGKNEFPENTLYAFAQALKAGADGIELDVQLSQDNIVVLYHPHDLAVLTQAKGAIDTQPYHLLAGLNAAYQFDPEHQQRFPLRTKPQPIPTLAQVLEKFPQTEIVIDFKSLSIEPLVDATIKVVSQFQAWDRVIFYSTQAEHLAYLQQKAPQANIFERRTETRARLLTLRNQGECTGKAATERYAGFELDREMQVVENFNLGKSCSSLHFRLWDKQAIACFHRNLAPHAKIFLFGINTLADYQAAQQLGVYAIFSDAPSALITALNSRKRKMNE